MNRMSQNVEDFKFILQEIARFSSMSLSELKDYFNNHKSLFDTVPHPDGRGGGLICGQEAYNRFCDISKRYLSFYKEEEINIDIISFTGLIRNEFVKYFLKDQKELNESSVSKMLATVIKIAKKKHESLTHYIPCVIVYENDPEEFSIGPVRFVYIDKFLNDYHDKIEKHRLEIRESWIERSKKAHEEGKIPIDNISSLDLKQARF